MDKHQREIHEYLIKMQSIQNSILKIIENEQDYEDDFTNLIQLFDKINIRSNKYDLKLLFRILIKIANSHFRGPSFFDKIEKILNNLKNEITTFFPSSEIFNIFKSNKKILLFLIKDNFIILDKTLVSVITNYKHTIEKYPNYFYQEIRPFIDSKYYDVLASEIPDNYEEKRKIGENDSRICELIRNDSIDEFITYVNSANIPLSSHIKPSLFETNSFLTNKEPTLMEYAAFFGSMQIFNYLRFNNVSLTESLWPYAIHSNNAELIHFLEENKIEPKFDGLHRYSIPLQEAIKCHHNDIAKYILDNYLQDNVEDNFFLKTLKRTYFKFYDFSLIQEDYINKSSFYNLCQYDYFVFADIILKSSDIDINTIEIFNINL